MSLTGGHLDALLAAGASAEQIVALVKADMAEREKALGIKRAKDAERQRRHRESRDVTVTERDGRDPSPKENNQTPTREKNTEPKGSCKNPVWACPPKVDPIHWRDFLKNRKTKHLTNSETAYHGQLKALADIADDEWPPGRLVQHAAEKGWGSINDPRKPSHGQQHRSNHIGKSAAAYASLVADLAPDEPF